MRPRLAAFALLFAPAFEPVLSPATAREQPAEAHAHPAVVAYRSGDFASAAALWREELESAEAAPERARLAYDLGNCAYRDGALLEAVAWYTASLRLAPRDADAWHNLELARSEAGLEPADRGDLDATLARLLSSLTLAESEWLLLAMLATLLAALLGEAWRGRTFRPWVGAASVLVLVALAPWIWNLERASDVPLLVIAERGAPGRSEPQPTATVLGQLEAGSEVEWVDELPDWTKVRDGKMGAVWVKAEEVFDLGLR